MFDFVCGTNPVPNRVKTPADLIFLCRFYCEPLLTVIYVLGLPVAAVVACAVFTNNKDPHIAEYKNRKTNIPTTPTTIGPNLNFYFRDGINIQPFMCTMCTNHSGIFAIVIIRSCFKEFLLIIFNLLFIQICI